MNLSLPGGLHFLQRGWHCCNQILLKGGSGPVLVDSGHLANAPETLALLEQHEVSPASLAAIVTTHAHIDHFSANHFFRQRTEAPLLCGALTATFFRENDRRSMWISPLEVERWSLDEQLPVQANGILRPGEMTELGGFSWEILAGPGHAPDTICLFQREHGILISADTMMTHDCATMNVRIWPDALEEALDTLERWKSLPIRVALPGHGPPIVQVKENIAVVQERLRDFQTNPARMIRHLLARSFVYLLMTMDGAVSYTCDSAVAMFSALEATRDYASRLGVAPDKLSERLLEGFVKRGVVGLRGESLEVRVRGD